MTPPAELEPSDSSATSNDIPPSGNELEASDKISGIEMSSPDTATTGSNRGEREEIEGERAEITVNSVTDSEVDGDSFTENDNSSVPPITSDNELDSKEESEDDSSYSSSVAACVVHESTPIPNSDAALRILRKFLFKSAEYMPTMYGGSKGSSFFNFIFGSDEHQSDECCEVYADLWSILNNGQMVKTTDSTDPILTEENEEDNIVIESILGHDGDTMSKSRLALAAFSTLVETWCEATSLDFLLDIGVHGDSEMMEMAKKQLRSVAPGVTKIRSGREGLLSTSNVRRHKSLITGPLLAITLECVKNLVAHGCVDGVVLVVNASDSREYLNNDEEGKHTVGGDPEHHTKEEKKGGETDQSITGTHDIPNAHVNDTYIDTSNDPEHCTHENMRSIKAIDVFADSIFLCSLSTDDAELSALNFLLTAGCRTHINSNNINLQQPTDTASHKSPVCIDKNDAMLGGNRLLQAIRLCYHVYQKTNNNSNRITARAALRQIVAGVFARIENRTKSMKIDKGQQEEEKKDNLIHAIMSNDEHELSNEKTFPSHDHKDAFLVLKSLCKISIKSLSDKQKNNSNDQYDASGLDTFRSNSQFGNGTYNDGLKEVDGSVKKTSKDPTLDSKIMALDRLNEILQRPGIISILTSCPPLIFVVRHYLCDSLLKNCMSDNTMVVSLSLRLFVPLIGHFRSLLKSEIEAFVTNVFFVILDSKNSLIDHKRRVVILFEEICSDADALAEIFLNYDCDLSAVDLFQRIVNTLAKVAKIGLHREDFSVGGSRGEKIRQEHRELRLEAMRAVKQVLTSLHTSIIPTIQKVEEEKFDKITLSDDHYYHLSKSDTSLYPTTDSALSSTASLPCVESSGNDSLGKQSLVQIYDSKKKRREEEANAIIRFNQKPSAGIKYASEVSLINGDDPADVACYLLSNKEILDKTQIGEYLGREPDYQNGFPLKVLDSYISQLDFSGMLFDDAIKFYLSGFRLPGEAQKIDRIMEKFAERYTLQNKEVFPTSDAAFILAFSIIMLNTDLHNPAIKEERRMTKDGFIANNRGICDGEDLPRDLLTSIFDRIKANPISLKEDDEARERTGQAQSNNDSLKSSSGGFSTAFFSNRYAELDKERESNFHKERDQIVRSTESMLRRKKSRKYNKPIHEKENTTSNDSEGNVFYTKESGLKDEYVIPMFDVTWGPALAVFSTAMESANGTMGSLLAIASDEEIEWAAENAASAIEVCLDGFNLAICTAGMCGNDTARSAYVNALSNFSLLGTGRLVEHRHLRCVQTLFQIARDDGDLLGSSWEHILKALSEVARLRQVYEYATKSAKEGKFKLENNRLKSSKKIDDETFGGGDEVKEEDSFNEDKNDFVDDKDSVSSSESFSYVSDSDFNQLFEEEMDKKAIDEANAFSISENISDDLTDSIYHRSTSLSITTSKDFILQLCRVSRMEISGYGGHVGSQANNVDLTSVHYRLHHTLLENKHQVASSFGVSHNQPDIYSLQKIVEITHYNMEVRPKIFLSVMWNIVSSHLTSTALHTNPAVAIYAVDSFRQLIIELFKRDDLGVHRFQSHFLQPLETIMGKSKNSSVKEFLLKSIEQIISLFGGNEDHSDLSVQYVKREQMIDKRCKNHLGNGWKSIFHVMGLAAYDSDDVIAIKGFKLLTNQLQQRLKITNHDKNDDDVDTLIQSLTSTVPIPSNQFIGIVNALLKFVSGPREDKSALSIEYLVSMCSYLASDTQSVSNTLKGDGVVLSSIEADFNSSIVRTSELELWWPILLGISKSVGDSRSNIRTKSLTSLLEIVNEHFFFQPDNYEIPTTPVKDYNETDTPQHGDLQTLQLIFRGILAPILEHAETSTNLNGKGLPLKVPDGFIRFSARDTKKNVSGGRKDRIDSMVTQHMGYNNWIESCFDHLMDGSVSLVLKSMKLYKRDDLVEEVLAMFNNCLISDSGALAVRGLQRLYHFITNDLLLEQMTDDTWAAVCHLFRGCLLVRGLPNGHFPDTEKGEIESTENTDGDMRLFQEFLVEDEILSGRRYIGGNAAMFIGSLLSNREYADSMGVRWYLFLLNGMGKGIKEWDKAADVVASLSGSQPNANEEFSPPLYAENSLYARKMVMRIILKLLSTDNVLPGLKSIYSASTDSGGSTGKRSATHARTFIKDECESLFKVYFKKEKLLNDGNQQHQFLAVEIHHLNVLMCDLLEGLSKLDDDQLSILSSLAPTLSECIRINDQSVRIAAHKVLVRIFNGP